ncbi:MAG: uncharacterized protein JWO60_1611 [Frankiales bacterium]|nr:uncharacterized protein [Frankiales bacterium]
MLSTGPRGLADSDATELGQQVLACWDAFLDVATAAGTDLSRPSRLPGWNGRDVCVHVGAPGDAVPPMEGILDSARRGDLADLGSPDAGNEAKVRAHRGLSDDEVLAGVVRARDAVEAFFEGPDLEAHGRTPVGSSVGPLPVLSLVHAATYELAVHGLDLAPCGAPAPGAALLDRGLGSLVDVTGALASKAGVHFVLTASTPDSGWRFTSTQDGWHTEPTRGGAFDGVGVRGTAAELLDASAGRVSVPGLLMSRRMVVQELPQWMRLAPLVAEVPGLPGGAALRGAVAGLGKVSGLLGRFRR